MKSTESHSANDEALCLTAKEVARLLRVSLAHVWKMNATGHLPQALRFGRAVRWDRRELEDWVAAGGPERSKWAQERHR